MIFLSNYSIIYPLILNILINPYKFNKKKENSAHISIMLDTFNYKQTNNDIENYKNNEQVNFINKLSNIFALPKSEVDQNWNITIANVINEIVN